METNAGLVERRISTHVPSGVAQSVHKIILPKKKRNADSQALLTPTELEVIHIIEEITECTGDIDMNKERGMDSVYKNNGKMDDCLKGSALF